MDPSGKDCGGAILDAIFSIVGTATVADAIYNAVIPAIIAATFFPPAVLGVIAVVTGLAIYLGSAIEIIRAINAAYLNAASILLCSIKAIQGITV